MLGKIRKVHFVGIGGIGMSGIAEVLLNLAFTVSGSDTKVTPVTDRLKRLPDQFLVCERAIGFRSIEQRDATVVGRANQLDHLLPVGRWPVRGTHAHTTQTEGGHF